MKKTISNNLQYSIVYSAIMFLLVFSQNIFGAQLKGGSSGGGGDICENRIQTIGADIDTWLVKGLGKKLSLPVGKTFNQYRNEMRKWISSAKIVCTDKDVFYSFAPKTCVNSRLFEDIKKFIPAQELNNVQNDEVTKEVGWIVCNSKKIKEATQADQYTITHHEYAGLAGLEANDGDIKSNYLISNQIANYLVDQTIKRLVKVTFAGDGQNWEDYITCNGGDLIIRKRDRKTYSGDYHGPFEFQVIITDSGVLQYFTQENVIIPRANSNKELLCEDDLRFTGYTNTKTIRGRCNKLVGISSELKNRGVLVKLSNVNGKNASWFFERCNFNNSDVQLFNVWK